MLTVRQLIAELQKMPQDHWALTGFKKGHGLDTELNSEIGRGVGGVAVGVRYYVPDPCEAFQMDYVEIQMEDFEF